MNVYDRIDYLLKKNKKSRRQLAALIGMPSSTLQSMFERAKRGGKGKNIPSEIVKKLTLIFDVSIDDLLYGLTFGQRLKTIRENNKISLEYLSEETEIPLQTLKKYEDDLEKVTARASNKIFKVIQEINPTEAMELLFVEKMDHQLNEEELTYLEDAVNKAMEQENIDEEYLKLDIQLIRSLLEIESSEKSISIDSVVDMETAELFGATDQITISEFIEIYLNSPVYFGFESLKERECFVKIAIAFKKLNSQGQQKAVEQVEDLAKIPDYQKKDNTNASE